MAAMKPDAYGVWDTQEGRWWFGNRRVWMSKGSAANAWDAAHRGWRYEGPTKTFSKQTRFVTKSIRFEAMD